MAALRGRRDKRMTMSDMIGFAFEIAFGFANRRSSRRRRPRLGPGHHQGTAT